MTSRMMSKNEQVPWLSDIENVPHFTPKIDLDRQNFEVSVIGGGIAGLVTAYLLAKEGVKVVLFERDRIISGQTGYTTAFVTRIIDTPLPDLEKNWGKEKAALIWKSGQDAIDLIEKIVNEEDIDCDFVRCPAYIYTTNDEDIEALQEEASLAQEMRFNDIKFFSQNRFPFNTKSFNKVENQARFHVGKYLTELSKKIVEYGGLIYEETKVEDLKGKGPILVKTNKGSIKVNYAVVATQNPFNSPPEIQDRLDPWISYVISVKVPKDHFEHALYWDSDDPYHYFRVDPLDNTFDLLTLGGEDNNTGTDPGSHPYSCLEEYLKTVLDLDGKYELVGKWSGEVLNSVDGAPYIGKSLFNDHQLFATGFSGTGMAFSHVGATVIRDMILNRSSPLIDLYSPKRVKAIGAIIKRGLRVVKHGVENVADAVKSDDVNKMENNTGAIIRSGIRPVAVYKDENGNITRLSALCTHQKCVVKWNNVDATWDCPCHGSRFSKTGKVLAGPATKDLPSVD